MSSSSILDVEQLECGYESTLFGPFDLQLRRGTFLLIEGPNGVGKSTLLKTLVDLVPPVAGSVTWHTPRHHRRFVPQVRTLDPLLPATVADVMATGLQRGGGLTGLRVSGDSREIDAALDIVGALQLRDQLFRELSEGQKQLVLLARALVGSPEVIVLDEPTASMDPRREEHTMALLEEQQSERELTIALVAHGSEPARRAASSVLHIDADHDVYLEDESETSRADASPHLTAAS